MTKRLALALAAIAAAAAALFFVLRDSATPSSDESSLSSTEASLERLRAQRVAQPDRGGEPASVDGRVLRKQDNTPVASAVVALSRANPSASLQGVPILAVTDANGYFVSKELRPGRYSIHATASGLATETPETIDLGPGEARDEIILSLSIAGVRLHGIVSDIGGGPIDGAVISATRLTGMVPLPPFSTLATQTKEDGSYELWLPGGGYFLSAYSPSYVERSEIIDATSERRQDFRLIPGGAIEGRVVFRETGEPAPGVTVASAGGQGDAIPVGMMAGPEGVSEQTTTEGHFRLEGLRSGAISLQAHSVGSASKEAVVVELGIGETVTGIEIVLDPAYSISGFVVESSAPDTGLADVHVGGVDMRTQKEIGAERHTGPDGYFEIHGIQPGSYSLGALGEGIVPSFMGLTVTVVEKDVEDVVLSVQRGSELRGRVDPPGLASIGVSTQEEFGIGNFKTALATAFISARSDEGGHFTLLSVPDGALTLVAETEDGRRGRLDVSVDGEHQDGLVLRLDDQVSLEGTVLNQGKEPVPNVGVRLVPSQYAAMAFAGAMPWVQPVDTQTGEDGRFRFLAVKAGSYELSVHNDDGQLAWAGLEEEQTFKGLPVGIDPERPSRNMTVYVEVADGTISGVVVDERGEPVSDAWVGASKRNERFAAMTKGAEEILGGHEILDVQSYQIGDHIEPVLTGPDGRFVLKELREGSYMVTAQGNRGAQRVRQGGVEPGEDLRLTLTSLATLRGVVTQNGVPQQKFVLSLDGPVSRSRRIENAKGHYAEARLEAGHYRLTVSTDEGRLLESITVTGEADQKHDVALHPWCSLTGQLLDAEQRAPLAGLVVKAIGAMASTEYAEQNMEAFTGKKNQTDSDGRFNLKHIPCGKLALNFATEGGLLSRPKHVVTHEIFLDNGEQGDAGVLYALAPFEAKERERGDLGFKAFADEWDQRPESATVQRPEGDKKGRKYLWVVRISDEELAGAAGLRIGDRIVMVDGYGEDELPIRELRDLASIPRVRAGQTVTLGVQRPEGLVEVTITAKPTEKMW